MSIGYINVGSSSVNQDNIDVKKYVTLNQIGISSIAKRLRAFLNANIPFEVLETQSLWVFANIVDDNNNILEVKKFKVFTKGKGTYGLDNLQFANSDFEEISTQIVTISDIENNPLTQVVTIEDLDGLNVSDYFNQMEPLELQDLSTAPRLIKTPTADYLFLAVGGIYGVDELQTTMSDFQLLDENSGDIEIKITKFSQLTNTELRSDKIYVLQNDIDQPSLDEIIVPTNGLTIVSGGYDTTTIKSSIPNATLFKSAVGGCANFRLRGLSIANTGIGSNAFDLVDKDLTAHEIGFNNVNFSGCVSLGKIRNFRQVIGDDVGFYGIQDGLIYSGANNGLKLTNFNGFGWNAACTLIKKDVDTTFANRLFISGNLAVPSGAILCDFISDNLLANELLQINSSQIKVNGVINPDLGKDLIPNLSANDLKCKWTGNSGIPNSAIENFVEDTDVSDYYNIDWLKQTYYLTVTGDTEFTESNLPASGKNTQEIKLYIQGDFNLTFPADWLANAVGTYKGSDLNAITLKYIKNGVYFMKIDNSLSVYPKPSLQSLVPTSLLPSNTASLTINGSFFTPETIVSIENQTVNSVEFINQGQLILSVTTSAVEEEVDITISNGTTVIFSGILPINLGVVFIPSEVNWEAPTGTAFDLIQNGSAKITTFNSLHANRWNQEFDFTKDFIVEFIFKLSPLGSPANLNEFQARHLSLRKASDNSEILYINVLEENGAPYLLIYTQSVNQGFSNSYVDGDRNNFWATNPKLQFRFISGIFYFYVDNVLKRTFTDVVAENMKLSIGLKSFDITNIKYIELP